MNYVVNTPAQLKPILVGYRKSNGMSQKDMAEKLNVTQQAYQALESNPQAATLDRLMRVLNVLGVKLYLSNSEEATDIISKPYGQSSTVQEKSNNSPSSRITKKLTKDSW